MTDPTQHSTERVVVMGGGAACAGIAQVIASAGYRVTLCAERERLEVARGEVDRLLIDAFGWPAGPLGRGIEAR